MSNTKTKLNRKKDTKKMLAIMYTDLKMSFLTKVQLELISKIVFLEKLLAKMD